MSRITRDRPLAGRAALVTGGSRGIGAAIAKRRETPNFDQTLS
jgi:short-subunit dehydrogenase